MTTKEEADSLTIDDVISRAKRCIEIAFGMKKLDTDEPIDEVFRQTCIKLSNQYTHLAAVLQEERRWEQEQIDNITKKAKRVSEDADGPSES